MTSRLFYAVGWLATVFLTAGCPSGPEAGPRADPEPPAEPSGTTRCEQLEKYFGRVDSSSTSTAEKAALGKVAEYLSSGGDPNGVGRPDANSPLAGEGEFTRLHVAAHRGWVVVADRLIAAGATVDARSQPDGLTPLYYAAAAGHGRMCALLMLRGADPSAAGTGGDTPLHASCGEGHVGVIRLLRHMDADPNALDVYGGGPLADALWNEQREAAMVMLSMPVDVRKTARAEGLESPVLSRMSPLAVVCKAIRSDPEMALAMLTRYPGLKSLEQKHRSFLFWYSISNGRTPLVRHLLSRGLDVNLKSEQGGTPLGYAAWFLNEEICRVVLHAGGDVTAKNQDGRTPLHLALVADWRNSKPSAVVGMLLDANAPVNVADNKGRTPAMLAARSQDPSHLRRVIEAGGQLDVQSDSARTPLMFALEHAAEKTLPVLLELGADVHYVNKHGRAAIHYCIDRPEYGFSGWGLSTLIRYGANVDLALPDGRRPLHLSRKAKTTRALLQADANANVIDRKGNTPLHAAARAGRAKMVELLLGAGAKVNEKNKAGKTPLDLTRHPDIIRLLRQAGGKGKPLKAPILPQAGLGSGPAGRFSGSPASRQVLYAVDLPGQGELADWMRAEVVRSVARLSPSQAADLADLEAVNSDSRWSPKRMTKDNKVGLAGRVESLKGTAASGPAAPMLRAAGDLVGKNSRTLAYLVTDGKHPDRWELLETWETHCQTGEGNCTKPVRASAFLVGRRSPAVQKIYRELAHRSGGKVRDMQERFEEDLAEKVQQAATE